MGEKRKSSRPFFKEFNMMESEVRDLSDDALINQALKSGMNELQNMVKRGCNVPMSEFAKLLIWAKEERQARFAKELEKSKREGWKIVEHRWCGVPINEFEIPSLGIYKQNR